jgi:hypothetical protein
MPVYNAYLHALDTLIKENEGVLPDLATPFTKSIVGRDDKPHTGLTVGHILKGAFEELSVIRPDYEDVRALEQFYNPNAPNGIHKPIKDYIDRLKSVAKTS